MTIELNNGDTVEIVKGHFEGEIGIYAGENYGECVVYMLDFKSEVVFPYDYIRKV